MKRYFVARFPKDGTAKELGFMGYICRTFIGQIVLLCLMQLTFSCQKAKEQDTWLGDLHDEARALFYQKDEPEYSRLLQLDDRESRSLFKQMYSELSRFAAHQFVESFFATDSSTELIRKKVPAYKDLDAVDLVIRSIGYHARLDLPETESAAKPLSPEFHKQGALAAAKFHEAHTITKGKGAKIAVLDTGIDKSHPIFKNTRWGKHFSLDGDTQNDPPYQLLSQCTVAAAIYRAVHDGNDIINISASGSGIDPDYLREACQYADNNNRIVISGALYSRWFNQGNTRNFPSQYDTVISALFALAISECPPLGTESPREYAKTIRNLVFENANPQMVGFEGFSPECRYGLIDAEKTVNSAVLLNKNRQSPQKKNHP
jgi:hypothetical protein